MFANLTNIFIQDFSQETFIRKHKVKILRRGEESIYRIGFDGFLNKDKNE